MDYEKIEALVKVLRESAQLTELEVRQGDVALRLRRPTPEPGKGRQRPSLSKATVAGDAKGIKAVRLEASGSQPATSLVLSPEVVFAPVVGIFHAGTKPVAPGDFVKSGQLLGQIEAMRLMNDCVALIAGRVQAVLVTEGQPVEYGQPLFEIVPEEAME